MANLFCRDRLDFLSDQHKLILTEHFKQPQQTAESRELAIKLGVDYSQVIAILAVLAADGFCQNWLLIYHVCAGTFVDRVPFKNGMPKLPYTCPHCERTIYEYEELQVDVMVETKESVEFV